MGICFFTLCFKIRASFAVIVVSSPFSANTWIGSSSFKGFSVEFSSNKVNGFFDLVKKHQYTNHSCCMIRVGFALVLIEPLLYTSAFLYKYLKISLIPKI